VYRDVTKLYLNIPIEKTFSHPPSAVAGSIHAAPSLIPFNFSAVFFQPCRGKLI
jgi:hypothetical protein